MSRIYYCKPNFPLPTSCYCAATPPSLSTFSAAQPILVAVFNGRHHQRESTPPENQTTPLVSTFPQSPKRRRLYCMFEDASNRPASNPMPPPCFALTHATTELFRRRGVTSKPVANRPLHPLPPPLPVSRPSPPRSVSSLRC
ncbi:hypothetical protein AAHE18_13G159300 [Arachis hypogaea]